MRIKGGLTTKRKHKKILNLAKGYRMTRSSQIKKAKEAVLHAGEYAFHGRKLKKREIKKLWIVRLNAATRELGTKYSIFIKQLHANKIELDRKVLSHIVANYPETFKKIVEKVK
jgi:large subunit ribosomal protein L20